MTTTTGATPRLRAIGFEPGSTAWVVALCTSRALATSWFAAYSAVLPLTRTAWDLTSSEAGSIQSAFTFGFLVSMFGIGFVSDRYGAKRTFIATAVAFAASVAAFVIFASGFVSACCLHAITGLCAGGTYSPVLALITEHVARERRGRAMGLVIASSSASFALCMGFAGLALRYDGWRGAMGAIAVLVVAAWPLAVVTLRRTPNIVHTRPAGENNLTTLLAVVKERRSMLSIGAYSFHNWELLGIWAWLPTFLAAAIAVHGGNIGSALSISLALSGLTYLANIAGSMMGGIMADRWGRTQTILVWSCASLVLSMTMGWLIVLPVPFIVLLACLCNMSAIADSSTHSTVLAEGIPPRMLGVAYSVRSVFGFGAGALSPVLFGAALDLAGGNKSSGDAFAWGIAWMTLGVGAALGPLLTWKLQRMSADEDGRLQLQTTR